MSNSTNKSIADEASAQSHHIEPERNGERESARREHRPDERGRNIEREVSRKAKKK